MLTLVTTCVEYVKDLSNLIWFCIVCCFLHVLSGLCLVRFTWGFVKYVGALSSILPFLLCNLISHPIYPHPFPPPGHTAAAAAAVAQGGAGLPPPPLGFGGRPRAPLRAAPAWGGDP